MTHLTGAGNQPFGPMLLRTSRVNPRGRCTSRHLLPALWALVVPGTILACLPLIAEAQVQVMVREVRVGEAPVEQDPDEEAAANEAVQLAQPAFMMSDDQFDQWVFGAPRNSRAGRNKLDSLLTLEVDDVARTCALSETKKKKLVLAGRGDIKRFFERVEEKRKKFDKVKTDQNKIGEIYQELIPLQVTLNSGLFADDSFYAKTLKKVLSEEEEARYQKVVQEKKQFRYRAKVELIVAQLDQTVGFCDAQRSQLVEIILRETKAPKQFGQYDYYLVMYLAGKIPEAKIKPLFEDKQWAFLQRQLNQGRGMEQFLRGQGLLPARDEAREIAEGFANALRQPMRKANDLPAEVFTPAP
jgi:hypothetical protein